MLTYQRIDTLEVVGFSDPIMHIMWMIKSPLLAISL